MREARFREMQERMLRNYRNTGVVLLVLAPVLWLLTPLGAGLWLGGLSLVVGIASLVRTFKLRAIMKSSE